PRASSRYSDRKVITRARSPVIPKTTNTSAGRVVVLVAVVVMLPPLAHPPPCRVRGTEESPEAGDSESSSVERSRDHPVGRATLVGRAKSRPPRARRSSDPRRSSGSRRSSEVETTDAPSVERPSSVELVETTTPRRSSLSRPRPRPRPRPRKKRQAPPGFSPGG